MSQYNKFNSGRPSRHSRPFGQYNSNRRNTSGGGRSFKKAYINPSRFIKPADMSTSEAFEPTHTFEDFNLAPLISTNLNTMGFSKPSPIQDKTIPAAMSGKDILGIADTGTGKTAAFAIPILNKLITEPKSRALILAPTRELAQQIEEQCRLIAKNSNLYGALLIGGMAMHKQLQDLKHNPRVIIGTPGRIKDHLERRSLNLDTCNIVVLDEVDRMLDMGFVNDIVEILKCTNPQRQNYYFSATLDARVKSIIDKFSREIEHISVKSGETTANVEQNIISFNSTNDRIEKLHELLITDGVTKALIFDDTHRSVERLSNELLARGFTSDSMHGGKSQSQRIRTLNKFKENHTKVLVATDVAARGIDVSDITHVINFSTPNSYEDYVHRIGRTGRAGRLGYAFTFVQQ